MRQQIPESVQHSQELASASRRGTTEWEYAILLARTINAHSANRECYPDRNYWPLCATPFTCWIVGVWRTSNPSLRIVWTHRVSAHCATPLFHASLVTDKHLRWAPQDRFSRDQIAYVGLVHSRHSNRLNCPTKHYMPEWDAPELISTIINNAGYGGRLP